MRLETKFVQVKNDPNVINAINNLAAIWGWTVQNVQVTDNKVTYEGNSTGWVNEYGAHITTEVITEHTNYASITYQRDMDHPNYARLRALEEDYNTSDNRDFLSKEEKAEMSQIEAQIAPVYKKNKWIKIISIIVAIYAVTFGSFLNSEASSGAGMALSLIAVAAIISAIYFGRKASKATVFGNSTWRNLNQQNEERREAHKKELIHQASMLA